MDPRKIDQIERRVSPFVSPREEGIDRARLLIARHQIEPPPLFTRGIAQERASFDIQVLMYQHHFTPDDLIVKSRPEEVSPDAGS